ncbi:hypothetical protein LCGC14_2050260, partial [marine sediment metagenome]
TITFTVDNTAPSVSITSITQEPLPNDPPVANAGGPFSGTAGKTITFDGSLSTDDGTILFYLWNFGDGDAGAGKQLKHTYELAGTYTITLKVTDDRGVTDIDSTTADISAPKGGGKKSSGSTTTTSSSEEKVTSSGKGGGDKKSSNNPPVANAGGPYSAYVDELITFDGSASTDSDGPIASFEWDFGDGGINIRPEYVEGELIVIFKEGTTDTQMNDTISKYNTSIISFSPIILSYHLSIDDGSSVLDKVDQFLTEEVVQNAHPNYLMSTNPPASEPYTNYYYSSAGTYVVTLTVTDNKGATSVAYTTAEITERPFSGNIIIDASATDASNIERVELYVDSSLRLTQINAPYSFIYNTAELADGTHTIEVRAYDELGNSSSTTQSINTNNSITTNNYDTTDPSAFSIDNPTSGWTTENQPTITWSTSAGASFYELYLDGVMIASNIVSTSFATLSALANGIHSTFVIAYDSAFNSAQTPTIYFGVDTTTPEVSITSPANNGSSGLGDIVTIQGRAGSLYSPVGAVNVSVDGGINWNSANGIDTWSYSFTPTQDQTYSLVVLAINAANTSSLTDTSSLVVDGTMPAVSISTSGGYTLQTQILATKTYENDKAGNTTKTHNDPLGINQTTTSTYDNMGKVLTVTDPVGNTASSTYDDLGQLVSVTDPNGNATADPNDGTTTFTYDGTGKKKTQTDALLNTTYFNYDTSGALI